jgi:hypothetical protein
MAERLLVAVLGNRNSGKSTTWNHLFNRVVKTGEKLRPVYLNSAQYAEVFLISGSPEEREKYVQEILGELRPGIVLCSTQYREDVRETFDFFFKEGYEVFVQWLNPGFNDSEFYADNLSLQEYLLNKGATLQIRDGRIDPAVRVRELRQFILGWANYRDLVRTEFPG